MSEPVSPRRRPSIVLIVSLCLNVALIGLIVAGLIRIHHVREQFANAGVLGQMAAMQSLPPDARAKVRDTLRAHRAELRDLRHNAVEARRVAYGQFAAEPFDAKAFSKSLAAVHAADSALEQQAIEIYGEVAAKLTPAERRAIVEGRDKAPRALRWLNNPRTRP